MFNKEKDKIQRHLEQEYKSIWKPRLSVMQTENKLSFRIDKDNDLESNFPALTTGWLGFVNFIQEHHQMGIFKEDIFDSISVNGIILNYEGEKQFWEQYEQRVNYG